MNLKEYYNLLYRESIERITSDTYEIDTLIHSNNDLRFGLSLIIRPPEDIKNNIQGFLNELKNVAPNQYYYPSTDIHVTVISIISCYEGFDISKINVQDYITLVDQSVEFMQNRNISFKGLTASPSCVMVQGYYYGTWLNELRDNLRATFKSVDVEQSMDERYLIKTAHSTVCRFSDKLQQKDKFLEILEKYRDFDFGTFAVDKLELVHNDWYHREEFSKTLHHFDMVNKVKST
ncbi:mutarotase [uncultured Gelidibacter sp.]|uniref:2'-5' RNA ligase family protein n=1 Tax=uncultured Gelidibacter sp. TaxID=259318 RepID=UPI0026172E5C|nr:mutarotase [uncultured Gelidibacter sp.]